MQRHNQRRQTGNQADELIKLVATHNPAVEAELRFYIAKFPGEVRRLLAEGKQVYKPLVDKRRHGGTPSAQTAEPRHQRGDDKKTKKEIEKQKVKKGEKASKHKKHEKDKKDKKHKKSQEVPPGRSQWGGRNSGAAATGRGQNRAANPRGVDWGSEGDDTETQAAVKAKAVVGEQRSDDSPPAMPLDAMWPWGEQGRTFGHGKLQWWGIAKTPHTKPQPKATTKLQRWGIAKTPHTKLQPTTTRGTTR